MKDAVDLIAEYNSKFFEETDNADWQPFGIETNGSEYNILFLGFPVFQSANDSLDEGQTLEDIIVPEVDRLISEVIQMQGIVEKYNG